MDSHIFPFSFREIIRREAIEFDAKGITLAYREVKTYEFVPERSAAEDINRTVVVPNLPFFVSADAYCELVDKSAKSDTCIDATLSGSRVATLPLTALLRPRGPPEPRATRPRNACRRLK